jgi:hypothetical protein
MEKAVGKYLLPTIYPFYHERRIRTATYSNTV